MINALEYLYGKEVVEDYKQLIALQLELDDREYESYRKQQQECNLAWKEFEDNVGQQWYLYQEEDLRDVEFLYEDFDFNADYDLALAETLPSDRELCILRIARAAAEKVIAPTVISRFFKEYDITTEEQVIFWCEYTSHWYK